MSISAMTRMYGTSTDIDKVWEDRNAAYDATGGFRHPPVDDSLLSALRATQPHVAHCTCRYCVRFVNVDSGDDAGRKSNGERLIWVPVMIYMASTVAFAAAFLKGAL